MTKLQDLINYATKHGVELTDADFEEAKRIQKNSRKLTGGWVDRFNAWFPRLIVFLRGVGDVTIVFIQTILTGPGLFAVLLLLLLVEQQRVFAGLMTFDMSGFLGGLGAWVLVLVNLTLELMVYWVECRAGWTEPPSHKASARGFWLKVRYFVGLGAGKWERVTKSPAHSFRASLKLVAVSILLLAILGSMGDVIASAGGTWSEAVRHILYDSTLYELAKWVSGFVFSLTIVITAQTLSRFVGRKAIDVLAASVDRPNDDAALALMRGKVKARAADHPRTVPLSSPEETVPVTSTVQKSGKSLALWYATHPGEEERLLRGEVSIREVAKLVGVSASTVQRYKQQRLSR